MMQTQSIEAPDQGGRARKREIALMSRSPSQRKRLAKRLGWAGISVGIVELAAPGLFATLIGAPNSRRTRAVIMGCGLREGIVGIGAVGSRRPRKWLWARFAGDILDLGLLGSAFASRHSDKNRLGWAFAAAGVITLMDALAIRRLGTKAAMSDAGSERDRIEHTRAVTIMATRRDVERCWQSMRDEEPRRHSEPTFTEAPGQRGIEVRIESNKLRARAVEAKLRRLKQRVEAGEVIQSDASIHRGRHPAQPSKRAKVKRSERELLR